MCEGLVLQTSPSLFHSTDCVPMPQAIGAAGQKGWLVRLTKDVHASELTMGACVSEIMKHVGKCGEKAMMRCNLPSVYLHGMHRMTVSVQPWVTAVSAFAS